MNGVTLTASLGDSGGEIDVILRLPYALEQRIPAHAPATRCAPCVDVISVPQSGNRKTKRYTLQSSPPSGDTICKWPADEHGRGEFEVGTE